MFEHLMKEPLQNTLAINRSDKFFGFFPLILGRWTPSIQFTPAPCDIYLIEVGKGLNRQCSFKAFDSCGVIGKLIMAKAEAIPCSKVIWVHFQSYFAFFYGFVIFSLLIEHGRKFIVSLSKFGVIH